MILILDL